MSPTHPCQLEEESFGMPCIFGDGQKHLVCPVVLTERPEEQLARMLQPSPSQSTGHAPPPSHPSRGSLAPPGAGLALA